jgi:hypothetical protein
LCFACFSASGSSQFIAYWAADSTALQAANFLGSLLFTLPLYYIAGLRGLVFMHVVIDIIGFLHIKEAAVEISQLILILACD